MLEHEGLCRYALELFFVCDPVISAQRSIGLMPRPYDELDAETRRQVDELVPQIIARNQADAERAVQPVVPPEGAPRYMVDKLPTELKLKHERPAVVIDRSIELPFETMADPVIRLIERYLD
jgi:hypothetical protein